MCAVLAMGTIWSLYHPQNNRQLVVANYKRDLMMCELNSKNGQSSLSADLSKEEVTNSRLVRWVYQLAA